MQAVWTIFQLGRPVNLLIGIFSVAVAIAITGSFQPVSRAMLAILSYGVFVQAGANTINDFFDIEIDRVNKPNRPLPQNKIQPNTAFRVALFEFAVAVFLAAFIHRAAVVSVLFFSVLLYFYSAQLKKLPLIGNLVVSLATAFAFLFGGIAVGRVRETVIPAIFAFLYHLGREIIKDLQDLSGDRKLQLHTFPLRFGIRPSLFLTTGVFLLLIVATLLPFLYRVYNGWYFLVILLGVWPVLLFSIFQMWQSQDAVRLGKLSNLLKADMLVGLFAILIG